MFRIIFILRHFLGFVWEERNCSGSGVKPLSGSEMSAGSKYSSGSGVEYAPGLGMCSYTKQDFLYLFGMDSSMRWGRDHRV